MPLAGLGVLILFIGWFGFNPGSTLNALDGRFGEVAMVTLLGGCGGVHRRLRRRLRSSSARSTSAWSPTA